MKAAYDRRRRCQMYNSKCNTEQLQLLPIRSEAELDETLIELNNKTASTAYGEFKKQLVPFDVAPRRPASTYDLFSVATLQLAQKKALIISFEIRTLLKKLISLI